MSNPWDPLPFPKKGDRRERITFRYVGLVVTAWESVEFELARLYSIFVGDPDGEAVQKLYGAGRIFRDRLSDLRRVAFKYHVANPNQIHEGAFDLFTAAAEGFADRRNEVAHGIVLRMDVTDYFRAMFEPWYGDKPQYLLVPPLYTLRSHKDGLPIWAYSSVEMNELAARLLELSRLIGDLRRAYLVSRPGPT